MVMAVAMANINAMRDEKIIENVVEHEQYFQDGLKQLADTHDIISDVRGAGYFHAVELSMPNGEPMNEKTTKKMVTTVLPQYISDAGLLIRSDSRGQAKLMLSPPLIARTEELDELFAGVDQVVSRAAADLA
jgi:adenosylmethionine-8-amino-7-oxononanoate aminotransferase